MGEETLKTDPTAAQPGGERPPISVVILNYRRRAELERTLGSVRAQSYAPKEIIVVDNNSEDGTAEYVAAHYPDVKLLALAENLGCGGRNRGIEAAQGALVVTLDNDVRFDSPGELDKVAAAFAQRPAAAVLIFKILDDASGRLHLRDWAHPRNVFQFADREFETYYIAEGACAFRRAEFLRIGGYYEPFRIGCEGWDLALRLLSEGQEIIYRPEIRVRHSMAAETRGQRKPYYYYTRNSIWIAFKDYSGWRRWSFLAYTLAKMLFFCWRPGRFRDFVRGLREGWGERGQAPRTLVNESGWSRLAAISAHRPNLWVRFRTHRSQAEI